MTKRLIADLLIGRIIDDSVHSHWRTYTVLAIIAIVAVVATVANPTPALADPGIEKDPGVEKEDDSDLMVVVSSDHDAGASGFAIKAAGEPNPWGCKLNVDSPHESRDDPGPGYIQAKANIQCNVAPPPHTASIWQELSKWEGSKFTILRTKTSYCPSGVGEPKCYPNLNKDRQIMIALY